MRSAVQSQIERVRAAEGMRENANPEHTADTADTADSNNCCPRHLLTINTMVTHSTIDQLISTIELIIQRTRDSLSAEDKHQLRDVQVQLVELRNELDDQERTKVVMLATEVALRLLSIFWQSGA